MNIKAGPTKVENTMNKFDCFLMPGITHWKHPFFFAYFPAGGAYANCLGDMMSTALGGNGFTWVSANANGVSDGTEFKIFCFVGCKSSTYRTRMRNDGLAWKCAAFTEALFISKSKGR